ncbi:protein kinase [Planctomycetota bacterium]
MPYPDFLIGESLHKGSDLVIMDTRIPEKAIGEPAKPISSGATGKVWLVKQADVIERAVKILCPDQDLFQQGDWSYFVKVFEQEMRKLASITHSHLAKLISWGQIPAEEVRHVDTKEVGIPYIVMEYVDGQPLHKYIMNLKGRLPIASMAEASKVAESILDLFDDVLSALRYMHEKEGIHSDIKEMNILVRESNRPEAVLVDLGAAHIFNDDHQKNTTYIATRDRISKEWQKRIATKVPSSELRKHRVGLDLYMFGVMLKLFLDEQLPDSRIRFDWQPEVLESLSGLLGSHTLIVLKRITDKCLAYAYPSAEEVQTDLAASKDCLVSPFGIPELSLGTDTKTSLVLPEDSVPLTKRMSWILNHPSVQRLRNISQLDFVSMIYLGATHNRLLHSVETYNLARRYIGILLGNPIFKAYCAERCKLEAALLAGLLHDLGHYPLGHVFEDYAFRGERHGPFANIPRDEEVTSALLDSPEQDNVWARGAADDHICECKKVFRDESILSLPDLIRECFNDRVLSYLRRILSDQGDDDEGILILRSIVNGPVDVDKICYLRTDSRYTGASYGGAVDVDSILASLTCTIDPKPSIAIIEKGICAAESVATGRRWMYQRVYWHRTNRAMMAMLRFVPQHLIEKGKLTFPQYFKATYSMSDLEAVRWLNDKFEKECDDRNLENPAQMILDGRRRIYKSVLEFSPTNTEGEDVKIREYLMGSSCSEWSNIALDIAKIAKEYKEETKLSDVLIDIPSKRRHEIGDPTVFRAGNSIRKLSELSTEFKETKRFFEEGALSCRIFIHPNLRKSLVESKMITNFVTQVRNYLKEATPR